METTDVRIIVVVMYSTGLWTNNKPHREITDLSFLDPETGTIKISDTPLTEKDVIIEEN